MLRAALAVALAAASLLAGCELVTGGTNGYTSPEAGATGCTSSSQCSGGQMCCYAVAEGGTPTSQCQASCPASEQPCLVASDCGDGGICWTQACPVDVSGLTVTVNVSTCGVIAECSQ